MCNHGEQPASETLRTNFALLFQGLSVVREMKSEVAPSDVTALVRVEKGARVLAMVRWGLIPSWWSRPLADLPLMIHARAETLIEKPAFRTLLKTRRAIMPLDLFYEYRRMGTVREPYAFALKSRETMGIAALWDAWTTPEGETIESAAMITTAPNALVGRIHDRMPAILRRADYDTWLSHDAPVETALAALAPYDAGEMDCWPVERGGPARRFKQARGGDQPTLF